MLSKNKIKFIHSLESKKGRKESSCFLAEGNKLVGDTLAIFDCLLLVATPEWLAQHPESNRAQEVIEATQEEIKRASLLKNPQEVLAVYRIPSLQLDYTKLRTQLTLVLDDVQDPGNVGTIIRLADWFGIEHVICSIGCADLFNPKTIQATMGAVARVKVHYMPLPDFFEQMEGTPIYGTFLDGENIYNEPLAQAAILVMGNEGKGIGKQCEAYVNKRILIPSFPADSITSESLNVATATAIACAEFRRQATASV